MTTDETVDKAETPNGQNICKKSMERMGTYIRMLMGEDRRMEEASS
jgi:hypothetical protein